MRGFTYYLILLLFSIPAMAGDVPSTEELADRLLAPKNFDRTLNRLFPYERQIESLCSNVELKTLVREEKFVNQLLNLFKEAGFIEHEFLEDVLIDALDRSYQPVSASIRFRSYEKARRKIAESVTPTFTGFVGFNGERIDVASLRSMLGSVVVQSASGASASAWDLVRRNLWRVVLVPVKEPRLVRMPKQFVTWRTWRFGYPLFLSREVIFPVPASWSPSQQIAWLAGALAYHAASFDLLESKAIQHKDVPLELWIAPAAARSLRIQAQILRGVFEQSSAHVFSVSMEDYLRAVLALDFFDGLFHTENADLSAEGSFDVVPHPTQGEGDARYSGPRLGGRIIPVGKSFFVSRDPLETMLKQNESADDFHRYTPTAMFEEALVRGFVSEDDREVFARFMFGVFSGGLFMTPPRVSSDNASELGWTPPVVGVALSVVTRESEFEKAGTGGLSALAPHLSTIVFAGNRKLNELLGVPVDVFVSQAREVTVEFDDKKFFLNTERHESPTAGLELYLEQIDTYATLFNTTEEDLLQFYKFSFGLLGLFLEKYPHLLDRDKAYF